MKITQRPVCASDDPFLFELYASTRATEMAMLPWIDAQKLAFLQMQFAAQKSSYLKEYSHAQHDVICRDGEPVGRLYLDRGAQRLHILDITIAERCRNEGIGSVVLESILREADRSRKATTIYVENFNPSVRLFERLGFRPTAAKEFLILLERPAAAAAETFSEQRPERRPEGD